MSWFDSVSASHGAMGFLTSERADVVNEPLHSALQFCKAQLATSPRAAGILQRALESDDLVAKRFAWMVLMVMCPGIQQFCEQAAPGKGGRWCTRVANALGQMLDGRGGIEGVADFVATMRTEYLCM